MGIVGAGFIGPHHIDAVRRLGYVDVLALADMNEGLARDKAAALSIPASYGSYDAMLADPRIEVVHNATPNFLHYPVNAAIIAKGKHVISEKPLVGSLQQVDEVIAAEKQAKGKLMPVLQYRFGDGIQQVRHLIDAGIAGKPYVATAETLWLRGQDYYSVPWRGKWASELGGVLMTHAIHIHDILTYLMGPIERLFGRVATRVNTIEVEDCVSASCLLASGALASLTATLGSAEQISRIRLAFEHVTFESDHDPYQPGTKPWRILPASPAAEARIAAALADWQHVPPRYTTQFALFHSALLGKGPLPVTTADARRALELVTAFYHSSETHTDVVLPIGPEHPKYQSWVPAEFRG